MWAKKGFTFIFVGQNTGNVPELYEKINKIVQRPDFGKQSKNGNIFLGVCLEKMAASKDLIKTVADCCTPRRVGSLKS